MCVIKKRKNECGYSSFCQIIPDNCNKKNIPAKPTRFNLIYISRKKKIFSPPIIRNIQFSLLL